MKATIEGVKIAGTTEGPLPVVLLSPEGETDVLAIFIRLEEAISIARGVDATDIGRPLTHDLLLDIVEELGGRVAGVEITGIDDGTYIAQLHLNTPRGETVIDARPSDSLALVARTNAPIEVAQSVFEEARHDRADFEDFQDIRDLTEDE